MKLRLTEATLRLRLSPHEVTALGAGGVLENAVRLGAGNAGPFRYRLELRPGSGAPEVEHGKGLLVVRLSRDAARAWIEGREPGVYTETPTGGESPLRLVVETDLRP